MSEENNLDSKNLCISEDAFEQFQVDSQYEEEEFITLSDIVSPERLAPQLPKDITEIPYDNEVVLSNFDDEPSLTETIQSCDAVRGQTSEQIDSSQVIEKNVSIEQSVAQTPQENESTLSRPKRARKQKKCAEDFQPSINYKTKGKKSIKSKNKVSDTLSTKPKRGRKPKQSLITQNEPTQPKASVMSDTLLEHTSVPPKRGRKKVSNNVQPDMESQTSSTVQRSAVRRGRKPKVTPEEGDLPPEEQLNTLSAAEQPHEMASEEQLADVPSEDVLKLEENYLSSELIINSDLNASSSNVNGPQKTPGRRGRKKKNPPEEPFSELPQPCEVSNSSITEVNSSTSIKKKGRKKKSVQDINITTNIGKKATESDDELDNLSLQALSQRNNSNGEDQVSTTENIPSSDIDVGYDELSKVQEFLSNECGKEIEINTEPQDMELDEPVDSSLNSTLLDSTLIEDLPVKSENIENVEKLENGDNDDSVNDSLLVEDSSRRPRRRAKKIFKYEEDSDEDPFANVELSDDEPSGRRKGKYQDDDEYVPEIESAKKGGKRGRSISESEDSDISDIGLELEQFGKKKKRNANKTPQKRGRKDTAMSHDSSKDSSHNVNLCADINVTTIPPAIDLEDDIEVCLQSSVIHANKDKATSDTVSTKSATNAWANTNAFESFIAQKIQGTNLQIKKVSSNQSSQSTPLEIPVLDPEAKKLVEKEVQTNTTKKTTIGVQTSSKHETPMKNNVTLSSEQSEQACEFLKSIVKTTSELGQLMTDKSEDFITKKIHTAHVTDTFKMDYCVKKSFLLLKLAKHNILQMEEDLSKQYEEFLKRTDLLCHREEEKTITATEKDSDSDCEIVEGPSQSSSKYQKAKFNPKTVFLNKELSIKIAKKPQQSYVEKKCQQLGLNKHSVWINDSVMVKKVKQTQSFLAQDSRNKKPPDCFVTEKMVSDFFENYYQKLAPSICAPFTSTEWLGLGGNYVCSYFFIKPDKFAGTTGSFPDNEEICLDGSASSSANNSTDVSDLKAASEVPKTNPRSLFNLCTEILKKHMKILSVEDRTVKQPCTLFRLCVNTLSSDSKSFSSNNYSRSNLSRQENSNQPKNETTIIPSLTLLCNKKLNEMASCSSNCDDIEIRQHERSNFSSTSSVLSKITQSNIELADVLSLKTLCYRIFSESHFFTDSNSHPAKVNTEKVSESHDLSKNESFSDMASESSYNENVPQDDFCEQMRVPTLLTLCHRKMVELFPSQETTLTCDAVSDSSSVLSENAIFDDGFCLEDALSELRSLVKLKKVSSLLSLCVEAMQDAMQMTKYNYVQNIRQKNCMNLSKLFVENTTTKFTPDSLKCIVFYFVKEMMFRNMDENENVLSEAVKGKKVKRLTDLCFEIVSACVADDSTNSEPNERISAGMTIDSVNTVSEDVFHNMEEDENESDADTTLYDEDNLRDDYDNLNEEDNQNEENSWVSQLKLQVQQNTESCVTVNNRVNNQNHVAQNYIYAPDAPILTRVKEEPLEESPQTVVDSSTIKAEPPQHDEMVCLPENIIPKIELNHDDSVHARVPLERQSSSSFDVDSFEDFVRRNKMMHSLDDPNGDIFSIDQTGHRVRRQHEPDYMNEYDPSLNLLVPQTFEPISVVNAKGVLMESSSDEEGKKSGQKRGDKRGRGRPRKGNAKTQKIQPEKIPIVKEKPQPVKEKPPPSPVPNEVAVLTRRMREKIRQEEKKVQSSDSESENVPIARRKDKDRKEKENDKTKSKNEKPTITVDELSEKSKPTDDGIQCNNVDSTEQIENHNDSPENNSKFTGFSAVDQNEITSYQKYVKFVYDKILPKDTPAANATKDKLPEFSFNVNEPDDRPETPLIDYDEPAEMLECEPTMPIFDEEYKQKKTKSPRVKSKVTKNINSVIDDISQEQKETPIAKDVDKPPIYKERNGWLCYPIDPKETKLYQNTALVLDKLPEDFVETYFRYQEISYTRKEDEEVNRLINLNSLNRLAIKEGKKPKLKGKVTGTEPQPGRALDLSRPVTPNSDGRDELTASEDEGANVDDEIPPAVPLKHSDNHLAKDSLMNESDSDDALSKIKQENYDEESHEKPKPASKKKNKKVEKIEEPTAPENLMLTADKMMNKELNLLHAPVVLSNELDKSGKGPSPKSKHKSGSKKNSSRDHIKNEEDSSSEEEKQWVNTKEKLLKRMVKKHDTATADDAKRAKLVCDFIERREGTECRKRKSGGGRRRNSRKMLERQKQMRVLQHELLGTSLDPAHVGGRHGQYTQSVFKGRRNIRKVIDKKSLARSTVIANMEEFERKRRLSQQQARLRDLLGCEEGVSVLVINDEVCLEYGFEEQRPLVTVHPFFTKVMKAHQYEGVKFMWDACFESLEQVESGHPGGGCILAHCMGLGKTLQVLALLHTVLTHPRVGMQRVLVCCPLSTVLNWVDEIHKWIGPVTDQIKVFELSKLKKTYQRAYQLEDWYSGGGIFIIGYELFRSLTTLDPEIDDVRQTIVNKIRTALLDPGPDIIVCDEGHLLKNDCSVLAVAMSRVATKRRIVLTGTPMQNNLREYYCMVNFIKPNLLGTYSEYSNRFENPIMNGQHRDSQEEDIKLMKQRTHILHKVLEGCLQRQEASVLYPYLPKKHEYTVFISLTQVQWDLYKHYLDNYSQKGNKHSILRDFHILQKIWSHPQVLHNFQMRRRDEAANKIKAEKLEDDLAREDLAATEDTKPLETDEVWWLQYQQNSDGENMLNCLASSNKFVVVFKILDECIALGDKVLIFSTSLYTMDALEYFLKNINKWSLGQEYYRLDGSVPAEVRQKWCREFNAEHNLKTKLFLISTRAGCLGLNMVAANRVIILDTSWNPAHDIQSIFRVYRFGQKKDCYIYRLVALGTMEQKIYERSVTKQAVACRVVDEQQIDRHYNMAELTELYKYDEEGASVRSGVAVGVEDVALLRVARHPALHAVHEHDSLLRGSSEQQLPEHERAAAWMQFQQEHAHKQMQNQLTSSLSLHLPLPGIMPNGMMVNIPNLQIPGPSQLHVKQEITADPTFQPTPDQKSKKGKKKQNEHDALFNQIPQTENMEATYQPDTETTATKGRKTKGHDTPDSEAKAAIEENMVKQIIGLLLKHNFQERQGPKEIAELVSTVRKMVAYGKPPKANSKLAKSIADVLLMKEGTYIAPAEDDPMKKIIQKMPQKKRGRPRKDASSKESSDTSAPATPQPSTSQLDFNPNAFPGRRRAAINAEKQIDTINSVIDIDGDDGRWQGDGDWQGRNSGDEEIVPEAHTAKDCQIKREKNDSITASNKTVCESIVLSDDEPERKQTKTKSYTLRQSKDQTAAKKDEVIPLHPSLLSNKNFIKIVAHTYLEGNPMLDEDAATLAAQYSTLKAKKELESTGRPIVNGPIYDIAIKVLGIDILKKLNKTNPVKTTPAPESESPVKTEPGESHDKQKPASEPSIQKTLPQTRYQEKAPEPKASEAKAPEVEKKRPGPRLKARRLGDLTESGSPSTIAASSPVPTALPNAPPYVVPVGFINRTPSMGVREPFAAPLATPFAPSTTEESILPDDDDVIASDQPSVPHVPRSMIRKNAKPLVLNSVLAATSGATAQQREPIPKLVISAGKLMPISKVTAAVTPPPAATPPTPTLMPQNSNSDTICLDSDEEESNTPNPTPPAKKRPVATKSTTKLPHAKLAAAPVPVSLTTSNPQLNAMLAQPAAPPQSLMYGSQQLRSVNPTNPNYIVIPSGKLTKLPLGVRPAMHNMQQFPQNYPAQSILPNPVPTAIHTSMGFMQPIYQDAPQNNFDAPVPTMLITPMSQPTIASVPQPAPLPKPVPIKPKPDSKTVCKPGDILRITATGHVEILNRDGEEPVVKEITSPPDIPEPSDRLKRLRGRLNRAKSRISATPPLASNPAATVESQQPESPQKSPEKTRKISSSSSSSEDSRPSTPDSDPLSILKDVVHIKAPEDNFPRNSSKAKPATATKPSPASNKPSPACSKPSPASNKPSPASNKPSPVSNKPSPASNKPSPAPSKPSPASNKTSTPTMVGTTSITKSKIKPNILNKPGPSNTAARHLRGVVTKPDTPPKTPDEVRKHISHTDTILKKLDKSLGISPNKTGSSSNKTYDTIDLDSYDQPSTSAKPNYKSADPKKQAPLKSKESLKKMEAAKKVVGTGKEIIISISGKSPGLTTASSGNKSTRVTNVEKVQTPAAKRPAPQPAPQAQKKKKTEPMTLKDFNIDDIDDIIELD